MSAMGRVLLFVVITVIVMMRVRMRMSMNEISVPVLVVVFVRIVGMILFQVDIELCSRDGRLLSASNMQMITADVKFLQLALQFAGIDSEVDERADKHVSADAAENVEIKRFHELILPRGHLFDWRRIPRQTHYQCSPL